MPRRNGDPAATTANQKTPRSILFSEAPLQSNVRAARPTPQSNRVECRCRQVDVKRFRQDRRLNASRPERSHCVPGHGAQAARFGPPAHICVRAQKFPGSRFVAGENFIGDFNLHEGGRLNQYMQQQKSRLRPGAKRFRLLHNPPRRLTLVEIDRQQRLVCNPALFRCA